MTGLFMTRDLNIAFLRGQLWLARIFAQPDYTAQIIKEIDLLEWRGR
ncbi:hypothetical protein [Paracoccus beibuensis]|nr:hypothetical protein [Paracoccus beibuensis]